MVHIGSINLVVDRSSLVTTAEITTAQPLPKAPEDLSPTIPRHPLDLLRALPWSTTLESTAKMDSNNSSNI